MDRPDYKERWEKKREWYAASGVADLCAEDAEVWLLEIREGPAFEAEMSAALKGVLGLS